MTKSQTFRPIKHRTIGSGTRLTDEIAMPFLLYHGARAGGWALRHWKLTGACLLLAVLWGWAGSLPMALLIAMGIGVIWVSVVVWSSARPPEGGSITWASLRQALTDYLADRRLILRLGKQWPLACDTAGLTAKRGGTVPRLMGLKSLGSGTLECTVAAGRIGVPIPNIAKQTVTLREVIGCRDVVVQPTGPGTAKLTFHWKDPIGRNLHLHDLPIPPPGDISYGIRQDGTPASVRANQSILIGGLTRHGKSNCIWALLADCVRQGIPVNLYVSDPKGGVELDAFEDMVRETPVRPGEPRRLIEVKQYAKTSDESFTMIQDAEKAMHARQYWMKQNGVRKIGGVDSPFDETNPLTIVLLDETLPLTDVLKKGTDSPLGRIAYTGAAAGYVIWANTQVAQIDALGRFRDLVPQRICFATPSPQVTDAVLGGFAESMGARCSEIREAGVGYSYAEGAQTAVKFRAALVTDAETKMIAQGKLPQRVLQNAQTLQAASAEKKSQRTALYRYYFANPDGSADKTRPAYIGISVDAIARDRQHNQALREFTESNHVHEVEWFSSRREAERAEEEAIRREKPLYNIVFNEDNPDRRIEWRKLRRRSADGDAAA